MGVAGKRTQTCVVQGASVGNLSNVCMVSLQPVMGPYGAMPFYGGTMFANPYASMMGGQSVPAPPGVPDMTTTMTSPVAVPAPAITAPSAQPGSATASLTPPTAPAAPAAAVKSPEPAKVSVCAANTQCLFHITQKVTCIAASIARQSTQGTLHRCCHMHRTTHGLGCQ